MKRRSIQYVIRSWNDVKTSCYQATKLKLRDGNSSYIGLILYDNFNI